MKDMAVIPEYLSRIDFKEVQALRIRMIRLDPQSGQTVLRFCDERYPPMIICAKDHGVPAPGSWFVKTEDNRIEFKSDLEFRAEFRLIS